jgi:hypothetical protein
MLTLNIVQNVPSILLKGPLGFLLVGKVVNFDWTKKKKKTKNGEKFYENK